MKMKQIVIQWVCFTLIIFSTNILAQNEDCPDAAPFCSDAGAAYPAGINNGFFQPSGNNYSCGSDIYNGGWSNLSNQPNAAWFYLEVSQSGSILIDLTTSPPEDIDFALWGPFSNLNSALSSCGSLGGAVSCSYNPQASETASFTGVVGQVYLLMITNFSNNPTNISANQSNLGGAGAGATDCTILQECMLMPDAGPDETICSNEGTYQLNGGYTGNPIGTVIFNWTGNDADATAALGGNGNVANPTINIDPNFFGQLSFTLSISDDVCTDETDEVIITIEETPSANNETLSGCETTPGSGVGNFDLTQLESSIEGGNGNTINWFEGPGASNPIGNPSNYNGSGTVVAEVSNGNCSALATVSLTVDATTSANNATINGCENAVGSGIGVFDLTTAAVGAGNINYYQGPGATNPISAPQAYFSSGGTVVAQVYASNPDCGVLVNINLVLAPALNCDDGICENGVETWNPFTCSCDAGVPPPPDACVQCPVINVAGDGLEQLCAGDVPTLFSTVENSVNYTDDYSEFGGFNWYSDASLITQIDPNTYMANSSESCNIIPLTLYVGLVCNFDGSVIPAGTLNIDVYPNFDAALLDATDDDCTVPIVTSACGNYLVTPSPSNPTTVNPGESGTANYTIELIGASCWSESFTAPYFCPQCPSINTFTNNVASTCSGGIVNLSSFQQEATYTDTDGTFSSFQWYTDQNLTIPLVGNNFYYGGNQCDPSVQDIYLGLICTVSNEPIYAGNVEITVYPNFNFTQVTYDPVVECQVPTVSSPCPYYEFEPILVPNTVSPGADGEATWAVNYTLSDCFNAEVSQFYSCPPVPLCPATDKITELTSLCSGDTFDKEYYENIISSTIFDPDATFGGYQWYSDQSLLSPIFSYEIDYDPNSVTGSTAPYCETETRRLYLGVDCTINPGLPISAGYVDVIIYPPFSETLLDTLHGNCADEPQLFNLCPQSYVITPHPENEDIVVLPGDEGVYSWDITFFDIGGTQCWVETYEVPYVCPPECDDITINDPLPQYACNGEDVTVSISVFSPNTATNGVDYELQWLLDGSPVASANDSVFTNNFKASGCDPSIFNVSVEYTCLIPGDSTITLDFGDITVIPDFDEAFIINQPFWNCDLPVLASTCDNYIITPTASVPTEIIENSSGSAVWNVTYNEGDCWTEQQSSFYTYNPILECPSLNSPFDFQANLCFGENLTLIDLQDEIDLLPGSPGTFGGYLWYSDAAYTNPIFQNNLSYSGDGCSPEETILYARMVCRPEGNDPICDIPYDTLDVGTATMNLYPPYDDNLVIEDVVGECDAPTITLDCATYSSTEISVPDPILQSGENGVASWEISLNGLNCFTETYTIPYDCPPVCPTIDIETNNSVELCVGETPTLSDYENEVEITDVNSTATSYQWFSDTNLTQAITSTTFNYGGNNCDAETFTIYLGLGCSLNNNYLAAGTLDVTLYPDYDMSLISADVVGECDSPTITSSCNNYILTETNVPNSTLNPGENGTAEWSVTYNGNNCWTGVFEVDYDCPEICPIVQTPVSGNESLCVGDTPDFATFENTVVFDDPNSNTTGSTWYSDAALTQIITPNDYTHSGTDNCVTETATLYYAIDCAIDPFIVPAGSIELTLYPDYDVSFVTEAVVGECDVPVVNLSCANYIANEIDVPNSLNSGDNGTATWEIVFNAENCWTETFTIDYDCPPVCPTITNPINETESICNNTALDLTNYETNLTYDDPNATFTTLNWYSDAALTQLASSGDYVHTGANNCDPENHTLYLGLICSLQNEPIAGGDLTITVYPDYDVNLIDIVSGIDCELPSVSSSCTNYIITPSSSNATVLNPGEAGNNMWNVDYDDGSGFDSCFSNEIPVGYACGEVCPVLSVVADVSGIICNGDNIELVASLTPADAVLGVDYEFTWRENGNPIVGADNLTYNTSLVNNDNCESFNNIYTLEFTCLNQDAPITEIFEFGNVTVVPDYDVSLVEIAEDSCGVDILVNCANYNMIEINVPTSVSEGENGTATWQLEFNEGNCWSETFDIPYDCPACPSLDSGINENLEFCANDIPDFNFLESQVVLQDDYNTFGGFEWFVDNNLTSPINNTSYVHSGNDNCVTENTTLYLGYFCELTGTYLAAGEINLTLYPPYDISLLNGNFGDDCSIPTVDVLCPNYEIQESSLNDVDIQPGESGNYEWSVSYNDGVNGNSCFVEIFEVGYACGAVCPVPTITSVMPNQICSGTPFSISVEVNPPTAIVNTDYSIQWLRNGLPVPTNDSGNLDVFESNTDCDPLILNYSLEFTCLAPGDAPQVIDLGDVTVLPDYDVNLLTENVAPCLVPVLQTDCANYIITEVNVPSNLTEGDAGTATWEVSYNAGDCFTETYNIDYICPDEPVCLIVNQNLADTESICVGENIVLNDFENQINFTDFENTFEDFEWFTDAAFTQAFTPNDINPNFADNCNPETVNLFVAIRCNLDNSLISAGTLDVTIYPDFDASFITTTEGDCALPQINSSCENYVLTPNQDNVIEVNDGDAGFNTWTVTFDNGNNCFAEEITVGYSCNTCSVVQISPLVQTDFCDGDVLELSFDVVPASAVLGTNYSIEWQVNGATVATNTPTFNPNLNNTDCDPEILEYTLIYTCLIPGDTPQTFDFGTINLYPSFNQNFVNETINECQVPILSSTCINYTVAPTTTLPTQIVQGESGAIDWAVSFDGNACFDEIISTNFNCPEIILPEINDVFIPTAFSPNNDGLNDVFRVLGSTINTMELYVFDRWGNRVYQTQVVNEGWDGNFQGKECEMGVYTFYTVVTYNDGSDTFKKGNVTLIR